MTTPVIPTTPAELEEFLADKDKVLNLLNTNPNGFKTIVANYARTVQDKDKDLMEQVRVETQRAMADFLKENESDGVKRLNLDPIAGPRKNRVINNPHAPGAPLNGQFADFTSFLQDTWHHANLDADGSKRVQSAKNYSTVIPDGGGFLVPEEFRTELLQLAMEQAIVRPRATVVPMNSPRLNFPSVDEKSRTSSVFGGVVVYRTEEGAELTESTTMFSSVKLDVTKQTALAHVPNELVRDWGGFTAWINASLPGAVAFFEDVDFLSGNGVGQPLGMLNTTNGALIAVPKEVGQAAGTIVWENVTQMYARMLPSSIDRAIWIASPDTFSELATMALSVGTGGSAVWIIDGTGKPRLTLLGQPVIMTEKAPGVRGTQGDLSFVDPSMYLVGDYQAMTVDSSSHVKFTSDKTTFRVIARNDGRPWLQSPLTPKNNSATLSPFIQLATR